MLFRSINKKGVHIYFLQKILAGKNISEKSFRPGFQVVSLEPVQVTEFLIVKSHSFFLFSFSLPYFYQEMKLLFR